MRKESFTVYAREDEGVVCYYVAPCTIDEKSRVVTPIANATEVLLFVVPPAMDKTFKSIYVNFSKVIGKSVIDLYSDNSPVLSMPIKDGVAQEPTNDKSSTN